MYNDNKAHSTGPGAPGPPTKEICDMRAFMDKDFLLDTPTARHLYHDYAADLPIIDYHFIN